jgi:hypothetical protein
LSVCKIKECQQASNQRRKTITKKTINYRNQQKKERKYDLGKVNHYPTLDPWIKKSPSPMRMGLVGFARANYILP